jgi:adenosylhomocysteine nucleosidase
MTTTPILVLVSANEEWAAVRSILTGVPLERSPYGEYFTADIAGNAIGFFHGGWGKVSAAGSTQYTIDHFRPDHLLNIGTCGGIEGRINRLDIVAVERAVIYDIHEAMGNSRKAVAYYTTELNVPKQLPSSIVRTTIYSADRDLTPGYLRQLEQRYRPRVVDWESGAIAWIAKQNNTPLLIVRGVTDLISLESAEAVGNLQLFRDNARRVMTGLIRDLPLYLAALQVNDRAAGAP